MEVQEAIEILKQFQKDTPKLPYDCLANKEIEAVSVLLNEYEKQQKEIQKLEARKYMFNAETGEITQIPIDNNYINKNKIKEKIEELKFLLYSFEKKQEEKLEYVDKGSMNSILAQISILNAVLEEQ